MDILRTPEERFRDLPGHPFEPHYVEINGLRVHYVDEGGGSPILCLHGEPTWSYLYRKMIPPLAVEHRALAMDFIGFGRSDKFSQARDYTFGMHCETLLGFLQALSLQAVTLVVQDWGGLIGLTVAAQAPERFARLVIMNTGLPSGYSRLNRAFHLWRAFAKWTPRLPIGWIIRMGLANPKNAPGRVIAAYEAPFPNESYKAGARIWPSQVPVRPDDPVAAEMRRTREALSEWEKPALVMFSNRDPITRGGDRFFRRTIPGASDQPKIVIEDAGHFLQEEKGEEISQHILAFMERTPTDSGSRRAQARRSQDD